MRQQIVGPEFQVLPEPFDRGIGISVSDDFEELLVFRAEYVLGHVVTGRDEDEAHLFTEVGVQSTEAGAANGTDGRVMERHVSFDDVTPGRARRQLPEPIQRCLNHRPRVWMTGEPADGLTLQELAHVVDVRRVPTSDDGDSDASVGLAIHETSERQLGQGGSKGLAAHPEPLGQLDLRQLRAGFERPVEDLPDKLIYDGVSRRDASQAYGSSSARQTRPLVRHVRRIAEPPGALGEPAITSTEAIDYIRRFAATWAKESLLPKPRSFMGWFRLMSQWQCGVSSCVLMPASTV